MTWCLLLVELHLDAEHRVGQRLHHRRLDLDRLFFLGQTSFRLRDLPQARSVRQNPRPPTRCTATVCSKCADRLPSSRHRRPAVRQSSFTPACAGVHHRLDRQHHALGQPRPAPGLAVVGHLRLLVQRGPMPWPTNSRTTENPCASTCSWTAWPMSDSRPPGRTCAIAVVERLLGHPQQRSRASPTWPTAKVTRRSP